MYISLFIEHTLFLILTQGPSRLKAKSDLRHVQALQLLVSHDEVRRNMFSRQRPRLSLNAMSTLLKLSYVITQLITHLT